MQDGGLQTRPVRYSLFNSNVRGCLVCWLCSRETFGCTCNVWNVSVEIYAVIEEKGCTQVQDLTVQFDYIILPTVVTTHKMTHILYSDRFTDSCRYFNIPDIDWYINIWMCHNFFYYVFCYISLKTWFHLIRYTGARYYSNLFWIWDSSSD